MFCWYMFRNGPGNLLEQYGQFTAEYYPILLSFLVLVPPIIWDAVKFCHRVGGPIYRVRMTMLDVADGAPMQKIQFRKAMSCRNSKRRSIAWSRLWRREEEEALSVEQPVESRSQLSEHGALQRVPVMTVRAKRFRTTNAAPAPFTPRRCGHRICADSLVDRRFQHLCDPACGNEPESVLQPHDGGDGSKFFE